MKKTVLLFCGGRSEEHEISLISIQGILKALDRSRYSPVIIGIARDGTWYLEKEESYFTGEFRADTIKLNTDAPRASIVPYPVAGQAMVTGEFGGISFDVAFPMVHGPLGEDGTLQGLLDIVGVPYVGSGCQASAVCMDKELTKVLIAAHGIRTAEFVCVKGPVNASDTRLKRIGLPVFVKPARLGSSVGITKVENWADLDEAVRAALKWDSKCLIEQAIGGREIECAVLGRTENPRASLPGEIIPSKKIGWYSYEAKYLLSDGAETSAPASLSANWTKEVQSMAISVFQALECSGMARIDMFLDETNGLLYLNEVNTIPGFTPISMYPKMWEASGLSYPSLVAELLELAQKPT